MKRQSACVRPLRKDVCFARSSLTCFKMEKNPSQTFAHEVDACKAERVRKASPLLWNCSTSGPLCPVTSSDTSDMSLLQLLRSGYRACPILPQLISFLGPNFLSNYVVTCRNYVKLSLKPGEKIGPRGSAVLVAQWMQWPCHFPELNMFPNMFATEYSLVRTLSITIPLQNAKFVQWKQN